jgi:hypothetical protein
MDEVLIVLLMDLELTSSELKDHSNMLSDGANIFVISHKESLFDKFENVAGDMLDKRLIEQQTNGSHTQSTHKRFLTWYESRANN